MGVLPDPSPPYLPRHVPAALSGAYPARPGNFVRPLVDGVPAFRRIAAAIAAARHSVWLTVAFYADDFRFPDNAGTLFDVLDRAAARGLDVRALFWRPNAESAHYGRAFAGTPADLARLRDCSARFSIRWDQAHAAFCQHQKSWLIDAGRPGETAFVGGINLTAMALGSPGHRDGGRHDLYVEVAGPSATDVRHNFVQRWNEASEREKPDGIWGPHGKSALAFPTRASEPRGASLVQIQRTVHPGRYTDSTAAPNASRHDISAGERSCLEQYERAIEAARSSIYIENQALPIPSLARKLDSALRRGVEVVLLVPAEPETAVRDLTRATVESLAPYDNFTLAGLILSEATARRAVYVHAKTMLVDDAWATIGSCNLHANSLTGNTEMNASIWDAELTRALRCELLAEHLGRDTSGLDDRSALRLFRALADANRKNHSAGQPTCQGNAVRLAPGDYG
ncbi:MAG TPA: phosphatidylserine/phosphatidylglycerophosphate/cardiolipin synthase family protein [Acetobacteraceae bacterium]|nr:phosphatidylserine/phosphatidylglycerophosphate/cardiolipin synthase family protein [Acetobacteraceae bacterium]